MSDNIIIAGSLLPSTTDTPSDGRTRVATIDDIADIENPFVGLLLYVEADSSFYFVKSLKSKLIGEQTVADAAVDEYELLIDLSNYYTKDEVATQSASNECVLNIRIPEDEDSDALTLYLELSTSLDFSSDIIDVNSVSGFSAMTLAYDGEFSQLTAGGIPPYAYSGLLIVDLTSLGADATKAYYARCRWFDGAAYTAWNTIKFYGTGTIEMPNVNVTAVGESTGSSDVETGSTFSARSALLTISDSQNVLVTSMLSGKYVESSPGVFTHELDSTQTLTRQRYISNGTRYCRYILTNSAMTEYDNDFTNIFKVIYFYEYNSTTGWYIYPYAQFGYVSAGVLDYDEEDFAPWETGAYTENVLEGSANVAPIYTYDSSIGSLTGQLAKVSITITEL